MMKRDRVLRIKCTWDMKVEVSKVIDVTVPNVHDTLSDEELMRLYLADCAEDDLERSSVDPKFDLCGRGDIMDTEVDGFKAERSNAKRADDTITVSELDVDYYPTPGVEPTE